MPPSNSMRSTAPDWASAEKELLQALLDAGLQPIGFCEDQEQSELLCETTRSGMRMWLQMLARTMRESFRRGDSDVCGCLLWEKSREAQGHSWGAVAWPTWLALGVDDPLEFVGEYSANKGYDLSAALVWHQSEPQGAAALALVADASGRAAAWLVTDDHQWLALQDDAELFSYLRATLRPSPAQRQMLRHFGVRNTRLKPIASDPASTDDLQAFELLERLGEISDRAVVAAALLARQLNVRESLPKDLLLH